MMLSSYFLGQKKEKGFEMTTTEEVRDWVFTFGCGQVFAKRYHVIKGTKDSARDEMFARFGQKWSMQYESKEDAGVEEYGLKEMF